MSSEASSIELFRLGEWFGAQSAAFQRALLAISRRTAYPAGTWMFGEEDDAGGIFAILSGSIRVYATPGGGAPVLFDLFRSGDWLGQTGLLPGGRRAITAVAADDSELLTASRIGIQRLVREHPHHWQPFMELARHQIQNLLRAHAEVLRLGPEARIAARLAGLSRRPHGDQLRLTQAELAEMVGLERKTVHRALAKFRKAGSVALRYGAIEVLDRQALARLADVGNERD
jgi:CRP/FNR family cyclic AMP-dependent transcriptional regulator